jgi:hypothetical protein
MCKKIERESNIHILSINALSNINVSSNVIALSNINIFVCRFVKFKGFSDSPYPGGEIAKPKNDSYTVPPCDWYNNGTEPRCSGFYHVSVCQAKLQIAFFVAKPSSRLRSLLPNQAPDCIRFAKPSSRLRFSWQLETPPVANYG